MRSRVVAKVIVLVALAVGAFGGCSPNGDGGGSQPDGEIWQWALGRNVWADEALAPFASEAVRDGSTDIDRQEDGFKLTFDSSGVVTMVTVFNDEAAIGLPGTGSYRAYPGALPGGVTWEQTPADLGAEYGAQNQSGGYGTDIMFSYQSPDGYLFDVGFVARHERDLPGSPIHFIQVRRG